MITWASSRTIKCFNPLIGIPVFSTTAPASREPPAESGFNPLIGIPVFSTELSQERLEGLRGFNPLIGIPVFSTSGAAESPLPEVFRFNPLIGIPVFSTFRCFHTIVSTVAAFQSPNRDSGLFYFRPHRLLECELLRFNPLIGIPVFSTVVVGAERLPLPGVGYSTTPSRFPSTTLKRARSRPASARLLESLPRRDQGIRAASASREFSECFGARMITRRGTEPRLRLNQESLRILGFGPTKNLNPVLAALTELI